MSRNISSSQNIKFNFLLIEDEIKRLEKVLLENNISETVEFKKWQNDFTLIYGSRNTNIQFYITTTLLYFIGLHFLSKFVLKSTEMANNDKDFTSNIKDLQYKIINKFKIFDLFDFKYFNPIFALIENGKLSIFPQIITSLADYLFELDIEDVYKFDFLIQKIISPIIRHKSGEFYTMPFLVKIMVDSYLFGERVLDPCCGSGNFLIEVIKKILSSNKPLEQKILAINNLYGYDINPISIFLTKINFMILLNEISSKVQMNLFVIDSLFPERCNHKKRNIIRKSLNSFDLLIGNPPWYTFRDIELINYQDQIKSLAENLGIKPLPKNILNIEISALFFYQAKELYLKNNGRIFFVMTKGVITGSHASRFRNFRGFKNVKIWTFDKKIESIFNIDFICLYAEISDNSEEIYDKDIPSYKIILEKDNLELSYFDDIKLDIEKGAVLVPYLREKKVNKVFTKKLIPRVEKEALIPSHESYYKDLFHKGADLNPRNLIFVSLEEYRDSLVKINPDERIFKKAKKPWDKIEFNDEIIENKYIFKVMKSTELVKFAIFDHYNVFLPLNYKDLSYNYDELGEHAKNFYDKINKLYLKYKKTTTKNKSLMDNLNRWSKLINSRQKATIKVAYNNSGSILNAVVIEGHIILTGDLSFYTTENIEEAYYLSAVLNSPLMQHQISIKKSSRHIFKIPFEIPIKEFNPNNQNHIKLAQLGEECHRKAKRVVMESINKENQIVSKIKLQKTLNPILKLPLKQINEILKLEFD